MREFEAGDVGHPGRVADLQTDDIGYFDNVGVTRRITGHGRLALLAAIVHPIKTTVTRRTQCRSLYVDGRVGNYVTGVVRAMTPRPMS
ncbi:hypothetical protein GCM10011492_12480 [Flexivirga endophytica]|uniref:Uncharacterized protein n=1 Tax=Flexivirga endophytica TaxID=1849103 RepID=A0A916SYR4_9MICO|nr:hypothetical protein GCM10011492_12480 [Flexivirga endophytica]GHB62725.1 hypothetical protein GCM10008112_34600 [Flexivirga endophytica]